MDSFASDRVVEELLYTGALINNNGRLLKANPLLWEFMERHGKEEPGSQNERETWNLIQETELALREFLRKAYEHQWPGRALEQMKYNLGHDEWEKLLAIQIC